MLEGGRNPKRSDDSITHTDLIRAPTWVSEWWNLEGKEVELQQETRCTQFRKNILCCQDCRDLLKVFKQGLSWSQFCDEKDWQKIAWKMRLGKTFRRESGNQRGEERF